MKRLSVTAFVLRAMVTCRICCGQRDTSRSAPSPEVAKRLQNLLDELVSQPNVVNYVALVDDSFTVYMGVAGDTRVDVTFDDGRLVSLVARE